MKWIKKYNLFEKISNDFESKFPDIDNIQDIFYDISDDGIINSFEFVSIGYLLFPYERVIGYHNSLRSQLYNDMSSGRSNWINEKPKDLFGDSWKDLFLDASDSRNVRMLQGYQSWVNLEHVKKNILNSKINNLTNKCFDELLIENIENGNIKAYPYIMLNLKPYFLPKHLDRVIECFKRVYDATGFRPIKSFWIEDFVDDETGEVVILNMSEFVLVSTDDTSYKNLSIALDRQKEFYKHFL